MPIKRETNCRNKVGRGRYNVSCNDLPTFKQQLERSESKEIDIFDMISTILTEEIPIENVLTISQSLEPFKPLQEPRNELTLTEKVQVDWSPELYNICHKAKDLYNFALFVCRKIFLLYKRNPNVSWDDFLTIRETIMPSPLIKNYAQIKERLLETFDKLKNLIKYKKYDKIGNTLSTLLRCSKFYESIAYKQSAQQVNRVLGGAWQTYKTNLSLYHNCEIDHKPNLPHYKPQDGEFMMIYTGDGIRTNEFKNHLEITKRTTSYKKYKKTTAELLFPERHRNQLPLVRVRYNVLKNLREVRIIPYGSYYEIEIRYNKPIEDLGLCKNNAIAIDLGVNNPLTIVNNLGLRPILLRGKELKKANYVVNSESPYYRSIHDVYGDILKKFKKEEKKIIKKTVLQIIQEKIQKYLKNFQWKKKIANIIFNTPTMTYDQFKNLHGKSKKLKNLFNYLKNLPDTDSINEYLFYEEDELNRKLDIYDDLVNDLKGKLEATHIQRVKDLQRQYQTILDGIWKIYRNKTRDATHKMSHFTEVYCKQYNIGTIIIGYNEGWKIRSELSKAVNRRFIPLPFYKIIQSIKYKAMLCGITVIVQEEGYTSKCSALDNESIEWHLNYDGIRNPTILGKDGVSHRHYGQFYSYKSDKYIHSDVNGAFNIGRKGKPLLFDEIPQSWMLIPPKKIAIT